MLDISICVCSFVRILKNIQEGAISTIRLHEESQQIRIKVTDLLLSKLFTLVLEEVSNKLHLHWSYVGFNINGERLSYLQHL